MTDKKIIKISPSTLNLLQSCSRAAHYSKTLNYSSPRKPDYLMKGEIAHAALETFYLAVKEGVSHPEARALALEVFKTRLAATELGHDEIADMVLTMIDYFNHWSLDAHLEILEVEKPFSQVIFETEGEVVLLEGKIDLIARHKEHDKILVTDHKTGDQNRTPHNSDNQYTAYALVTGSELVMENRIVWGRAKTKAYKPAEKFHRSILNYSPEYLEEWRQDTLYWVLKFEEEIKQDYFPPNRRNCKFCQFKTVCEWSGEENRLKKLEMDFVQSEKFDLFENE